MLFVPYQKESHIKLDDLKGTRGPVTNYRDGKLQNGGGGLNVTPRKKGRNAFTHAKKF